MAASPGAPHGEQDRPLHRPARPAQEADVRGDLRRAGPHALAGRAPAHPRIRDRQRGRPPPAGLAAAGEQAPAEGLSLLATPLDQVLALACAWLALGALGLVRPSSV